MPSWLNLVRPAIRDLVPFSSARSQTAAGARMIYLDANENPYDEDERHYNRYPDPQPPELIKAFADLYGVPADHVLVTLGSEAGIDHLIRVFCESGRDAIMTATPTFMMYEIMAGVQGARCIRVPLRRDDMQLDMPALRAAWMPECKLLFLTTPNNPMSTLLRPAEILELCVELRGRAVVVVDEAYAEFSPQPSLVPQLAAHDNMVILRTLSKGYGLAGARCGALLAQPEMITYVRKVMTAYPIPRPTVDAALAALAPVHRQQRMRQVKTLIAERERLAAVLAKSPEVRKIFPSATNFLLVEVADVDAFMARLRQGGVVVRDRRSDWPNAVRITVGTPEENDQLLRCLARENAA